MKKTIITASVIAIMSVATTGFAWGPGNGIIPSCKIHGTCN